MMNCIKKNAMLLLGDEKFYIPMYFKRIGETTEEIFMSITQDKFYKVRSKVRKQIFESFLDYWQTSNLPEIDSDNYWEYFLLSQEFSILTEQILLPKYEHIFKICLLKALEKNEENSDKSSTEKLISQDIDFYLANHLDQLFSLPITSLYNIFNDKDCNISDYDALYQIILSKSSQNNNFFILLGLIKSDKLKTTNFIDSSAKRNERFGFYPVPTEKTINSIRKFDEETKLILNENKLLKAQIINLKKIQKSSEIKITEYLNQINQLKQTLETKQQEHIREIQKMNRFFSCFQEESNEKIQKLREKIQKNFDDDDDFEDDDSVGIYRSQKVELNRSPNSNRKMLSKTQKLPHTMKSSNIKSRQAIDILFIIDASNSNKNDFDMLCEKSSSMAFDYLTSNRASNTKFGCICCFESNLNQNMDQPQKVRNFCDNENFNDFLDELKENFESKSFDFAMALESAVNDFLWRKGKRIIVCISGSSFEKTVENERNLLEKVTKLVMKDICFIALETNEESHEAFLEIKKIYESKKGPLFHIQDANKDVNLSELIL